MSLHYEKLTVESMYRFCHVQCSSYYQCLFRVAWTVDPMWIPLILELMSTLWFFSENKGSIVLLLEKAAVSRWGGGGLPRVAPLFYVLLHRSSVAPMRSAHCDGSQATFLAVICRGDHHRVGRLGQLSGLRWVSQQTTPRKILMEWGISQMTGGRGDAVQPSAASPWQGFGVRPEKWFLVMFSRHSCLPQLFEETRKRQYPLILQVPPCPLCCSLASGAYERVLTWEC